MGGHRPVHRVYRSLATIDSTGKLSVVSKNEQIDSSGIQTVIGSGNTSNVNTPNNIIDDNYTVALISLHFTTTDKTASSVAVYTHTKTVNGHTFTILNEYNYDESNLKISLNTTSGDLTITYSVDTDFRVVKTTLI
jgi:hypothetical protein